MKKCAAGLAALFLIVIFLSPRAFAAGYELPEGTSITAQSAYFVNLDTGIVVFEQNADEQRSVASPVSYTHLDVYKRQPMNFSMSFFLSTIDIPSFSPAFTAIFIMICNHSNLI